MDQHHKLIRVFKDNLFPVHGKVKIDMDMIEMGRGVSEDLLDGIRGSVPDPEVAFTASVSLLAEMCMLQPDRYRRLSLIDRLPLVLKEMIRVIESEGWSDPEEGTQGEEVEEKEEDVETEPDEDDEGEGDDGVEELEENVEETGEDSEEGDGEGDGEGEEEEVDEEVGVSPVKDAGFKVKPKDEDEED